jgi:hypothetical protein
MAKLVKLHTTWCGKIIVVAEIGEKAAEPRSGSVILEKVATFGPQSLRALTNLRLYRSAAHASWRLAGQLWTVGTAGVCNKS